MDPTTAHRRRRPLARAVTALVVGIVALGASLPHPATAAWTTGGGGASAVVAQSIPTAATPTAVVTGRNAAVSWAATTLTGGTPVDGYALTRVDASTGVAQALTSCTGTITTTSCTETNVPTGTWRYRVEAVRGGWAGPMSAASSAVTVSSSTLTFTSSTTIPSASLPATLSGNLAGFASNEGITYRLDGVTGPVLSGSPSSVNASGNRAFTVTIPSGTDNSPHSVFAVGSMGNYASAAITVVVPLNLTALEMFDVNTNGRIDRVVATFDRALAPYTAGVTPWTLTSPPSGATLSSVTVSGNAATLHLTEGTGTPTTAVGSFRVALTANAAGVRDVNGQTAAFSATAPTDRAAPALTALPSMNDADADGKVDQVTMAWSEALATYSAGTSPWSLAGVPSGGTLSSVSASGTATTLTISEGAGAADTAVGAFAVSLASAANGIRDAGGNRTSLSGVVPADRARPVRLAMQAFDDDLNGRFDRVLVNFTEALDAYSAGATPWSMTSAPSGTAISGVTVSGSSATLALAESTAPLTSIGSWRITLATNAAGIHDAADNLSSFTSIAPTDLAAPALVSTTMQDLSGGDGYVDRVALVFSETLATYSAGTTPWTLADAPSGSVVTAAARSTATINLTLGSPSGQPDTAVGGFTVSMAAIANGVRDSAGNITAALGPISPVDGAGPAPAAFVTTVTGSTAGRFEAGDRVVLSLSEQLGSTVTLASTATVTLSDPSGSSSDTMAVPGVFPGARSTGSNSYLGTNNASASFTGSTLALAPDRTSITITLGTCSGACATLGTATSAANFSVLLATGLRDQAGNAPATTARSIGIRLF